MLLTGVSGTGKSSTAAALRAHGCEAIDTDDGGWRVPADGSTPVGDQVQPDWIWDEPRMDALLAGPRRGPLVIAGCVENQGRFYDRIDHVVVLTAPWEVIEDRLRTRTTNPYGRSPEQQARIRRELEDVEPLLRRRATRVIDTTAPLDEVVATLLTDLGA